MFNYISAANAAGNTLNGCVQKYSKLQDEELFTGSFDTLSKNEVLKMIVSRVLDTNSVQENDEFFAEITNDIKSHAGILIPSGTFAHGKIVRVCEAKKFGRDAALDLAFDYLITPEGRIIPIKGKMTTRVHPAASASRIFITDTAYTIAGGLTGGLLSLNLLGMNSAIASQGGTVATGATLGGICGLGMALCCKGRDILISPGDEIRVKINADSSLPVYKKTAPLQYEMKQKGLDIKINNITYKKDPFGEVDTIVLALSISNMTKITFSIFDVALVTDSNKAFYPALFGDDKLSFSKISPGDKITAEIPFAVENVKNQLWLTFYDRKNQDEVAKISLNNAYRQIPEKSQKDNEKLLKVRENFYTGNSIFNF